MAMDLPKDPSTFALIALVAAQRCERPLQARDLSLREFALALGLSSRVILDPAPKFRF
jgi:hypothetical protein